jgi:predicted dehydrogenase
VSAPLDRRDFLRRATTATVAATAASYARVLGANDRIRLGLIGCGGRGEQVMALCQRDPAVEVAALCDVWDRRIEERRKLAPAAAAFSDHRALVDRGDVDAVIVATPDHWHVPIAVDALEAGKDVYVEKPLTFRREEGPRLVAASKASGRVCEVGMQQRSGSHYLRARDQYVRAGKLGRIHMVRTCWHSPGAKPMEVPVVDKPAGLDWKRWLGPVSWREWNAYQYFHYRSFLDFGGGKITDLFTHWIDAVHMLLGHDDPVSVAAAGGVLQIHDGRDAPDNIHLLLEYPEDFVVTFESTCLPGTPKWGIEFYGTEGRLFITRERFEFRTHEEGAEAVVVRPEHPIEEEHADDFLDCLRTRREPNATVAMGHRSAQAAHLGTLAYVSGHVVRFDPVKEEVFES